MNKDFENCLTKTLSDVCNVNKTLLMGIVNVTPDSFYSSSRCVSEEEIVQRVSSFLKDGATIIDLGGCSTRPGGDVATEEEELKRVTSALEIIRKHFPDILLSIDTFRGSVARTAVRDFAVTVINDVYSFDKDEKMLDVVAEMNVPYVLTHSYPINSGNDDFMKEIFTFFVKKMALLQRRGVEHIIIDPGYGFGKTMEQNFAILARQSELLDLDCPILAGLSRKRMAWQTLGITPEESLNGTTVLNTIAVQQGATILRVHDVKAAAEVLKLTAACIPLIRA